MKPGTLTLLGLLAITCDATRAGDLSFYNLRVTMLPETQSLEAALKLDYVHPFGATDSVSFLLTRILMAAS